MLRPQLLTLVTGFVLLGAPDGAAQSVSAGIDLVVSEDHVWRGLVVSNRWTIQPAIWAGYGLGRHTLAAGLWSRFEPWSAGEHVIPTRQGTAGLAELDGWLQHSWEFWTMGLVHYRFVGDEPAAEQELQTNTTELYVRLAPEAGRLPLKPQLVGFFNLAEYRGGYLELSLSRSVPVMPLWPALTPTGDVVLQAATGAYFDHPEANPGPLPIAYEDRSGISHADLSAMATLQLFDPIYAHLTAHHQWNIDAATRRLAGNDGTSWWFEMGMSVLLLQPQP